MPLLAHGPADPYDRMVYCGQAVGYRCPEVTPKTTKIVPHETVEPTFSGSTGGPAAGSVFAGGVIQGVGQQLASQAAQKPAAPAPVTFSNILFDFNSSRLTPVATAALQGSVDKLKGKAIELAGFTDAIGGEGYNTRLALKRAEAVRDYLVGQGIPAAAIQLRGQGLCCYVSANDSDESRRLNRRVEIRQKAS